MAVMAGMSAAVAARNVAFAHERPTLVLASPRKLPEVAQKQRAPPKARPFVQSRSVQGYSRLPNSESSDVNMLMKSR